MKQAMIAWYISFALLGLLLLTNLGWWCVWSSYDHVIVEETEFVIEQDSEGMNVITNCFNDERSKDGTEDNKKD